MSNTNYEGQLFNRVFNSIEDVIEFDPTWGNGTGYFNYATTVPVEVGALKASRDTYGRRIILIGTRYGTVVIFDRFKGQTEGGIYVKNVPHRNTLIKELLGHSNLTYEQMVIAIGRRSNLGLLIEESLKKTSKPEIPI